mgnify:CR=1 FL=1
MKEFKIFKYNYNLVKLYNHKSSLLFKQAQKARSKDNNLRALRCALLSKEYIEMAQIALIDAYKALISL